METGELIKLNEEKLPGCCLNRSDVERRGACRGPGHLSAPGPAKRLAPQTTGWIRTRWKAKLHEILRGAMAGRTMYVIPCTPWA
ncbi:MAG: hypothetical protein ACLUNO_10645 [Oscillospiraceae bacterium]